MSRKHLLHADKSLLDASQGQRKWAGRAGLLLAAAVSAVCIAGPAASLDFDFATHVQVDMYEQDVFVELPGEPGLGGFRVGPANYGEFSDAPVYATTRTIHHDPMNPDAAGPYPLGEALDMTLGDWLAATGAGRYSCDNGIGRIAAAFDGLVPDGVYTMWYVFIPTPAAEPFATYDLPIGDRAGRENAFFADANGHAELDLTLSTCLQGSGRQLTAALAIAWHSDGATYGSNPGGFGRATHVQLFAMLPMDDELNR